MYTPVARKARKSANAQDSHPQISSYRMESEIDRIDQNKLAPDNYLMHTTGEAIWIDQQCTPGLHDTEYIGI